MGGASHSEDKNSLGLEKIVNDYEKEEVTFRFT